MSFVLFGKRLRTDVGQKSKSFPKLQLLFTPAIGTMSNPLPRLCHSNLQRRIKKNMNRVRTCCSATRATRQYKTPWSEGCSLCHASRAAPAIFPARKFAHLTRKGLRFWFGRKSSISFTRSTVFTLLNSQTRARTLSHTSVGRFVLHGLSGQCSLVGLSLTHGPRCLPKALDIHCHATAHVSLGPPGQSCTCVSI